MDIATIKLKSIEAARHYYTYLETRGLGIDEIVITKKNPLNDEENIWILHISRRLFNPDSILIKNSQYDEVYGLDTFEIKEYDEDSKLLIIQFLTSSHFNETPARNLKIVSDLKFLIKNVEDWFTEHGLRLYFDNMLEQDENEDQDFTSPLPLKDSQPEAFRNILNNKYNYVWGPPGTGKTRFILSSAILHHLKGDNPKIGIFAPTNNALDQVLDGVLEHFDEFGLDKSDVIRVGVPTSEYKRKYPETIEDERLEQELKAIKKQIQILEKVLEYNRGRFAFNSLFTIQGYIEKIDKLNTSLDGLFKAKSQKEKELHSIKKESRSFKNQIKRVLNISTIYYQNQIAIKDNELSEIKEKIKYVHDEISKYFERIRNIETRSDKYKAHIDKINTINYLEVRDELKQLEKDTKECLAILAKDIEEDLAINGALAKEHDGLEDEELRDKIKTLQEKYKEMKAKGLEERLKSCKIIGMTLDKYIGGFQNFDINFTNIFLDEAGYAPLIKFLPLFSNRCSITFIGDHKQLPPICEYKTHDDIPDLFRILWSKPSLFAEMIFNEDEREFISISKQNDCPEFQYTQKSILKESYRYGQNLAEMLDRLVYNVGYKSALDDGQSIDLCFVNIPNPAQHDGRRNEGEAQKILDLMNTEIDCDYYILTPYKKQVALLKDIVPVARRNDMISTIHKSQGREWDTVAISVVDGSTIRPWFTNSTNTISQGLYVMNTAISRAKKKLIIVCDAQYWSTIHDSERQLISELIRISRNLDLT